MEKKGGVMFYFTFLLPLVFLIIVLFASFYLFNYYFVSLKFNPDEILQSPTVEPGFASYVINSPPIFSIVLAGMVLSSVLLIWIIGKRGSWLRGKK
jgi:glucan phosphoethanolaminetransferase (alkaline phosphatase superfamily)